MISMAYRASSSYYPAGPVIGLPPTPLCSIADSTAGDIHVPAELARLQDQIDAIIFFSSATF